MCCVLGDVGFAVCVNSFYEFIPAVDRAANQSRRDVVVVDHLSFIDSRRNSLEYFII